MGLVAVLPAATPSIGRTAAAALASSVYIECPTFEIFLVQGRDGIVQILRLWQFDETEPSRFSRVRVSNDVDLFNFYPALTNESFQRPLVDVEAQITHKKFIHELSSLLQTLGTTLNAVSRIHDPFDCRGNRPGPI